MHSSFILAALSLAGLAAAAPSPLLGNGPNCPPGGVTTVTVTVTEPGSGGPTTVPTTIPTTVPTTTPSNPPTTVPGGGNPTTTPTGSIPTTTPGGGDNNTTPGGGNNTTPGGGNNTTPGGGSPTTTPGGGNPTTTQPPTSSPPQSTDVPPTSSASPTGGNDGGNGGSDGGHCNTGPVQCCNSVQSSDSHEMTGLLGLLGILLPGGAPTMVGSNCSPLTGLGLGGSGCKSAPVCCENNEYNGLINIGCVPINIQL